VADFVLVNPPLSAQDRYGKLAGVGNELPNLGLAYLAGYLRECDIDTAIVDAPAQNLDIDATARAIADQAPLVCGLTATTLSVHLAAQVAAKVKLYSPDCVTLLGGPHVTSLPEQTLDMYRSIDYAVLGEGERTAAEVFAEVENNGDPAATPGVAYREGGEVRRSKMRKLIADLDKLPLPAWDLLPPLATTYRPSPQSTFRLPSTILFTARGCPYRCTFCDRSVFGRKLRMHSADRVWEMMEQLYRQYSIIDFAFHDESLFFDEGRLVQLCRLIQRSGLPLSFSCQGRVDQQLQEFTLRELAAAGCWQVSFGVESGDDEMLQTLGKGTTTEQAMTAIKKVNAAGISTKAFIMLGAPGETTQSLKATRDFLLTAPLDDAMVDFFTPFPGTDLAVNIEKHGELIAGYEHMSEHEVVFVPHDLTARALETFRKKLYRSFYLRPRVIRHYLRRLREPSGRAVLFKAVQSFLKNFLFGR